MLIEYPFITSQTQHGNWRENDSLFGVYLENRPRFEEKGQDFLSSISIDTPAVSRKTEM